MTPDDTTQARPDAPTTDTRPPLEKAIRVDAPIETVWKAISDGKEMARWFTLDARITPGTGTEDAGRIWLSFGPGMEGEAPLAAFDEHRRLGWVEDHGSGRRMTVDFHLEPAEGGTVVRLVQSGFGPEASWDDYYDGVDGGWTYFLMNLKHYVEHHWGAPRENVWRRHEVSGTREEVWDRLFGDAGLAVPDADRLAADAPVTLRLGGLDLAGAVLLNRAPRHFATTIPDYGDGLAFVELEGSGPAWHLGIWISLYGEARIRAEAVGTALGSTLAALFPATE